MTVLSLVGHALQAEDPDQLAVSEVNHQQARPTVVSNLRPATTLTQALLLVQSCTSEINPITNLKQVCKLHFQQRC